MLEQLSHVPNVVWAALIGAFVALLGVLVSSWNSRRQIAMQLQHDSEQRDREREMKLRQDVYISAARAMSNGQLILTRMTNLDLADGGIGSDYEHDSSRLSEIMVVGTNKTVQAVENFSLGLGSAILELSTLRMKLVNRKNEIELLTELIDASQTEVQQYLDMMKEFNLRGDTDQGKWELIERNIEFEQTQRKEYLLERESLWAIQEEEYFAFVEACMTKFIEVSGLIPPAVFAIRDELELPLNQEKFLEAARKSNEKGIEIFQAFLNSAKDINST